MSSCAPPLLLLPASLALSFEDGAEDEASFCMTRTKPPCTAATTAALFEASLLRLRLLTLLLVIDVSDAIVFSGCLASPPPRLGLSSELGLAHH